MSAAHAPAEILRLVETFARNLDQYRSPSYKETEARVEFINPFWTALGWDMDNKAGYAMQYRDVVHEDAIREGAPDYCFRIGGTRKFFLEAKRPGVDIRNDPAPAYQLRRYAWSCDLPVSVLTDFEEFAVYDCRVKPKEKDKASAARILICRFDEYIERWEEISSVFSREAILKGSFDKFVEGRAGRKRGTTRVDDEFLQEIEGWRELLAKDIASRNASLDVRALNFAVQKTIDRIIFLRMCEDRGIEPVSQLQGLCAGARIYPRLLEIYRKADEKYNSGLFHFQDEDGRAEAPDTLTPKLDISDKALKEILSRLYYPQCPYEFSVLPVEILGNVYEQFLGKVIRLTAGHHAKVEEKPEVRKAGGVYYTPSYIVDYIVKNTVGRLCEGKTPKEVSSLRILDPACGSGSFLLGAYQYLLDWHLRWYLAEKEKTGAAPPSPPAEGRRKRKGDPQAIYETAKGWLLTTSEKKRILLNNIYGVDIDSQAVEVTKLSLLLRVLENENRDTLQAQMRLWHERALPDLADNIKCGNSLIGPDFYAREGQSTLFADEETRLRVNVFDWSDPKHGFGEIMKAGGFDAVIGNPPYVRSRLIDEEAKEYFARNYETASYQPDTFAFFLEKGIRCLSSAGKLGFIIPNGILTNTYYAKLREWLIGHVHLDVIVDLKDGVFKNAAVDTSIFVLSKPINDHLPVRIGEWKAREHQFVETPQNKVSSASFRNMPGCAFNSASNARNIGIFRKLVASGIFASSIFEIRAGMKVRKCFISDKKKGSNCRRFILGESIAPYTIEWKGKWVNYDPSLEAKYSNQAFREESIFLARPKLLIRQIMGKARIYATQDNEKHYVDQSIYVLIPKTPDIRCEYSLGLLSSKLLAFYFGSTLADRKRTFPKIKGAQISQLPIRPIDFSKKKDKAMHDRMVEMVEAMLDLHKRRAEVKTPDAQERLARDIASLDRQIDELVYQLYGLTDEEIKIVEESGSPSAL